MSTRASQQLADVLFPKEDVSAWDESILDVPLEQRRVRTETYDFTISTLLGYLKESHVTIPDFQRRWVWTQSQASRLIESLIIQCPLPVIYLNQEPDETLSVIDGNQRLTALQRFTENRYELRGLTTYPDLNKLRYFQLDQRFQRHILNRTMRCVVIMKDTHPQVKFDVFERLNSGAVRLNAQELRNGIYHGPFMDALREMSKNESWRALAKLGDDSRMRGEQLVLRFLALRYDRASYRTPVVAYLNEFAEKHRGDGPDVLREFRECFVRMLGAVHRAYGQFAFRLVKADGSPENQFNAALFDAEALAVVDRAAAVESAQVEQIERFQRELVVMLREDREFLDAVTLATSDKLRLQRREQRMRALIAKHFGS